MFPLKAYAMLYVANGQKGTKWSSSKVYLAIDYFFFTVIYFYFELLKCKNSYIIIKILQTYVLAVYQLMYKVPYLTCLTLLSFDYCFSFDV